MAKPPILREAKAPASFVELLPSLAARLPDFIGIGVAPARSLAGLSLAFVGVGSIGLPLAIHCARLAPTSVTIVDPKCYKPESLLTHPILPSAVGHAKAEYAARLCKELSPATQVRWLEGSVQQLPLDALADADMVFMATDNLQAEVETGQLCQHLARPLIHASVYGPTLSLNARFFSNALVPSACPACAFGAAEWAQLNSETRFSCEGSGPNSTTPLTNPVTRSLSFLCSTAADLAMMQFLRHRLKLGAPVADTNLEFCGYTHRSSSAPLVFNPDCPCDHTPFMRSTLPRALADLTPRELIEFSGLNVSAPERVTVNLDRLQWHESGLCACAAPRRLRRFFATSRVHAGRCGSCRQPIRSQPFFTHPAASMPLLTAVLDRPLRALGAGQARWAVVRHDDRAVLLRNPSQTSPP